MTNVRNYELEKAVAQSDTAREAETTNLQSPSEATEDDEAPGAPDAAVHESQGGHFCSHLEGFDGEG